ncbi:PaaI family thioesterase [Candidatus Palauibacter polyketidifaciens]|uniref:PaaI family thioesterase n=1 Tax=Candidatus Palauibacter polyketidifaciens TaxID=3056740 RepID=UPI00238709C7|nr:PaaI family thioesterase [Candidatus Palauibacter polyketidifaciens]MDE2720885.1 PaaI family thioesterase [Candidatus Palauibacter polyketidifaciens]
MSESLQERYARESICFGCGPANPDGLRLCSFPAAEGGHGPDGSYEVIAEWTPGPNHRSFPGILNGGIIGTLLDCQCNWCAAHYFMRTRGLDHPPVTVTAEYTVRLRKPTPSDAPVQLRARIAEVGERKVVVEAELLSGGERTATCSGTFVAIGERHLAHGTR